MKSNEIYDFVKNSIFLTKFTMKQDIKAFFDIRSINTEENPDVFKFDIMTSNVTVYSVNARPENYKFNQLIHEKIIDYKSCFSEMANYDIDGKKIFIILKLNPMLEHNAIDGSIFAFSWTNQFYVIVKYDNGIVIKSTIFEKDYINKLFNIRKMSRSAQKELIMNLIIKANMVLPH